MICISESSAFLSKKTGASHFTESADKADVLKTEYIGRDIDKSMPTLSIFITLRANPNSSSSIIWADLRSKGALDHNEMIKSTDFQSDNSITALSSAFRY